jgi:hypothetical protein
MFSLTQPSDKPFHDRDSNHRPACEDTNRLARFQTSNKALPTPNPCTELVFSSVRMLVVEQGSVDASLNAVAMEADACKSGTDEPTTLKGSISMRKTNDHGTLRVRAAEDGHDGHSSFSMTLFR